MTEYKRTKQKDEVRYLLRFLGTDIESMPWGDYLKFQWEFRVFCFEEEGDKDNEHFIKKETVKNIQEEGISLLKKLLELANHNKLEKAKWDLHFLEYPIRHNPYLRYDGDGIQAHILLKPEPRGKNEYEVLRNSFFERFFLVLAQIECNLFDIQVCTREGCGKFFYKSTKRAKHFCSNSCLWIHSSREWRAKTKKTNKRR